MLVQNSHSSSDFYANLAWLYIQLSALLLKYCDMPHYSNKCRPVATSYTLLRLSSWVAELHLRGTLAQGQAMFACIALVTMTPHYK